MSFIKMQLALLQEFIKIQNSFQFKIKYTYLYLRNFTNTTITQNTILQSNLASVSLKMRRRDI